MAGRRSRLMWLASASLVIGSKAAIMKKKTTTPPSDATDDPADLPETFEDGSPFCALWLSESTIPGAGIGIFSAVEKHKGDTIAHGDICLPFIDMYWCV